MADKRGEKIWRYGDEVHYQHLDKQWFEQHHKLFNIVDPSHQLFFVCGSPQFNNAMKTLVQEIFKVPDERVVLFS